MLTTLARFGTAVAAMLVAGTTVALAETSATPAPALVAQASPSPLPSTGSLTISAKVRAYDFTRQNASNSLQDGANAQINQSSFELGIDPHVDYKFAPGWTLGGGYFYSNPFNGCTTAQSHLAPPCKVVVPKGSLPTATQLNFDDTLPGFELATLDEAYLQYKLHNLYVKVGNQIINSPWAPASDTRVKPNAFQGADAIYQLGSHWTIEGSDFIRYENRTSSDFSRSTLLTSDVAGSATQIPANTIPAFPGGVAIQNGGFAYGRVGFTGFGVTANLHQYEFDNIANATWFDGRYPFLTKSVFKPYVAVQLGTEQNAGASVLGKIDSQIYGIQGGVNLTPNVLLTIGYDSIPVKTSTVTLPTGYSCSAGKTIAVSGAAKVALPFFLPIGGTPDCQNNANGTTQVYYGGWASPYTDSYATDFLFTTSLTQGAIDRRSPSNSYKAGITFTSTDKRFVGYITYAGYDYATPAAAAPTYEPNVDATYYFGKPPSAGQSYRGFLVRYRYGERDIHFNNAGLPLFKYNRFQTEYDF